MSKIVKFMKRKSPLTYQDTKKAFQAKNKETLQTI